MAIKNVVSLGFYDTSTIPTFGFGGAGVQAGKGFHGAGWARAAVSQMLMAENRRLERFQRQQSLVRLEQARQAFAQAVERARTAQIWRNATILSEV